MDGQLQNVSVLQSKSSYQNYKKRLQENGIQPPLPPREFVAFQTLYYMHIPSSYIKNKMHCTSDLKVHL